jgi:hypothetical protein
MKSARCQFSYYLILLLLLPGCEKEVNLNIPAVESMLVVEGWIEQDRPPQVLLSLTAPFFSAIDSGTLRDYAVTRAKVTVIGPEGEEVLTLKPNEVYFPPYYYFGTELRGVFGSEYTLRIDYKGKTYSARTSIPKLAEPDSIWFQKNSEDDTLGLVWLRLIDNADENNFYRAFTKRIGKDTRYIPTFTSVFNDRSFNGDTLEISFSRGNTSLLDISGSRYFNVSDTLVFKLCSMDREHYEFWNSYQVRVITSANPLASDDAGLKTNIEDGIGIWGGYAASYDTLFPR